VDLSLEQEPRVQFSQRIGTKPNLNWDPGFFKELELELASGI
jgi:hypothetical protein